MEFSIFNFNNSVDKCIWDYVINIAGMIIIPIVIYLLSSVYAVEKKERENRIKALNSLTLFCKNLLQESLKLRINEARRRNALQAFINNPAPENFVKAFYMVRIPTLQYELFANDYAFTVNKYPTIVDLIFEISSNIKNVTTFVTETNIFSEQARLCSQDEKVKMAKELMLQLPSFHHNCMILSYTINQMLRAIQVYNSYYFFQDIIDLHFTGQMRDYLAEIEREMDLYYNPQSHNWRLTFLENLENPTEKFKKKELLYVGYLKLCGFLNKQVRNIKKEIYSVLKSKTLIQNRTVKTLCLPEKIEELHKQYASIITNFETCKDKFHSVEVVDTSLNLQLHKGLIAKLNQIITALKNIFEILPPERTLILTDDEVTQIEINLTFIVTNFIPCLNNIFKCLYLYYFPFESIENINFLSLELNEIIDTSYQNKLQSFYNSDFYRFIEAYDYSISNELPFVLSRVIQDVDGNAYVGIKVVPNPSALDKGVKEVFIYDFLIKSINLLVITTSDMYELILKCTKIEQQNGSV